MDQFKSYSVRIEGRLYKRIFQHIQLLKRMSIVLNKQKWLEDAIVRKLEKDEEQDLTETIDSEKHLSFQVNVQLDAKIDKRVEVIKKFCNSYSKKKWILESIYEKLDLEEKEIEKKASERLKSMLKESIESSETVHQ